MSFSGASGSLSVRRSRLLTSHALAFGVLTMISLAVLVRVRVGLQSTPSSIALMSVTYLLAAMPFFAGGAVVSLAIARLSGERQSSLRRRSARRAPARVCSCCRRST